jgi:hypothetical protein
MRPTSMDPPITPTPTGPPSRDPKAEPPIRSEFEEVGEEPRSPEPNEPNEHEGATETQVGDLTGPGAGYDEPSAGDKTPRRQPGVGA